MPSMNAASERITKKFIGAVEDEWRLYSNNPKDYTIGAPIGFGASSTVYTAQFHPSDAPNPIPCAMKVLDLDRLPPSALRLLQRETQLMSLSKHPNVLRVRGTWMEGHKLYISLRLMNAGSVVDVMRYAWPGGMEEEVVKCMLRQALEGLNYLHTNGLIHRDIKPANLLIDDDGTVLLGDLGVAAFLWDEDTAPAPAFPTVQIYKRTPTSPRLACSHHTHVHGHPHHHHPHHHAHPLHPTPPRLTKRKSFVGTPCYMAPEVINGKAYDASADIWSFGITALALTQGRAPRSLVSTKTALLQTVRDAAPQLDRHDGVHTYSRALQEVVARCLEKDPSKRPTAAELLAMPIFKNAKKKSFLVGAILQGLPPLASRMERQRQPSDMTRATMESWDFDASVTSPTVSVYSRRMSVAPIERAQVDAGEEAGYEADDNAEAPEMSSSNERTSAELYAMRVRGRPSRPHSVRSASWADTDVHSTTHSAHPAPIVEVEIPAAPSSSSSSSESESDSEQEPEPLKAALTIPTPALSSSPSASSYTSETSDSARQRPAYTSIVTTKRQSALAPTSPGLWRRLTARKDRDAQEKTRRGSFGGSGSGSEKDSAMGVGRVRRTTMAMLGRSVSGSGAPAFPAGDGGGTGLAPKGSR
ncbi:kinase-like protein [Daedalea quercina L-15889]|uniref:Kinase-like protein n=1 Tax=Daedalea quercina L-15889 TaxID=1314783 RepID=A0A165MDZ6_9APHY|nr:kinase-like protein [Daedalea quercina L-15889]